MSEHPTESILENYLAESDYTNPKPSLIQEFLSYLEKKDIALDGATTEDLTDYFIQLNKSAKSQGRPKSWVSNTRGIIYHFFDVMVGSSDTDIDENVAEPLKGESIDALKSRGQHADGFSRWQIMKIFDGEYQKTKGAGNYKIETFSPFAEFCASRRNGKGLLPNELSKEDLSNFVRRVKTRAIDKDLVLDNDYGKILSALSDYYHFLQDKKYLDRNKSDLPEFIDEIIQMPPSGITQLEINENRGQITQKPDHCDNNVNGRQLGANEFNI
jgi:site-specific recombinase XerD